MEGSRDGGRMRFRDVLAQIVGLLVLEGRVSYRALALQFDLDVEYLDAIRVELVRVKRLAVDESGEALVWAGAAPPAAEAAALRGAAAASPVPPLPALTRGPIAPRPAVLPAGDGDAAVGAVNGAATSPEATGAAAPPMSQGSPGAADAERRQLTVSTGSFMRQYLRRDSSEVESGFHNVLDWMP